MRGEELRRYQPADRCIKAHPGQRQDQQSECRIRIADVRKRAQDGHGGDHGENTKAQHRITTADLVRQRPEHRLQDHVAEQHHRHDTARRLGIHPRCVDQVFLHVGGESVEDEGASRRESQHGEQRAGIAKDALDRSRFLLLPD